MRLRYRTLNMNEPENLRNFLIMLGQPFRPYKEIQEELALTFMKKLLIHYKLQM